MSALRYGIFAVLESEIERAERARDDLLSALRKARGET